MTAPDMICIVGAGRSGTNLLARVLEAEGGFVNLYENRYIWNYGQRDRRTDRRLPEEASDPVAGFIRGHFARMAARRPGILIDKTPGNALRLGFVHAVLPQAKIVNIVRDGRANVLSRGALWDERSLFGDGDDPGLLARYLRHIRRMRQRGNLPLSRLPVFLADNLPGLAARTLLRRPQMSGERIAGLPQVARLHGTRIARAVQWREAAVIAAVEGRRLGPERYHEIAFETLLRDPDGTIATLYRFLGIEGGSASAAYLREVVDPGRLDTWRNAPPEEIAALAPYLAPALSYFGYESDGPCPR